MVSDRGTYLPGEPVNTLVALRLDGPNDDGGSVIAAGADFYATPELSRDGRLAWMEWRHPDMPWDACLVRVGRLSVSTSEAVVDDVRTVAGGSGESAGESTDPAAGSESSAPTGSDPAASSAHSSGGANATADPSDSTGGAPPSGATPSRDGSAGSDGRRRRLLSIGGPILLLLLVLGWYFGIGPGSERPVPTVTGVEQIAAVGRLEEADGVGV